MTTGRDDSLALRSPDDIVRARRMVRDVAIAAGFSLVDQTKIITAASEIARNTIDYGGGGVMRIECLQDGRRRGIRLTFIDQGPGIPDVERALTDGYSTGNGLGLGLSGAKRLSSEFDIKSTPGKGTIIKLARWR